MIVPRTLGEGTKPNNLTYSLLINKPSIYRHHAAQYRKPIELYALHTQDTLWR